MKFYEVHKIQMDLYSTFPNVFGKESLCVNVSRNNYSEAYIELRVSMLMSPYKEKVDDIMYEYKFGKYLREYIKTTYKEDIRIIYTK